MIPEAGTACPSGANAGATGKDAPGIAGASGESTGAAGAGREGANIGEDAVAGGAGISGARRAASSCATCENGVSMCGTSVSINWSARWRNEGAICSTSFCSGSTISTSSVDDTGLAKMSGAAW